MINSGVRFIGEAFDMPPSATFLCLIAVLWKKIGQESNIAVRPTSRAECFGRTRVAASVRQGLLLPRTPPL